MSYDIPKRLNNIFEIKNQISDKLKNVGLDTNIPFRQYSDLIEQIPESGAITLDELDYCTELAINISGEKA